MNHLYGSFSDEQIQTNARLMHGEVHKLLLYKDRNVNQLLFNSDDDFNSFFKSLMLRFSGLNELLFCPVEMVALLATLQAAYDMIGTKDFNYAEYRKLILDAHGYIKAIFEEKEVESCPL